MESVIFLCGRVWTVKNQEVERICNKVVGIVSCPNIYFNTKLVKVVKDQSDSAN